MVYNLTGIAGDTGGMLSFVQGVNEILMFGGLGIVFLIGIGVVMFMSFMWVTNDSSKSIAGTSFLVFSLSILLRAMDLLSNRVLFIVFIICAVSIAAIWPRE